MNPTILIVEDQFIEANNLQIILRKAGYTIIGIAASVNEAMKCIAEHEPQMVLLDIYLKGQLTGIDLAKVLQKKAIPFIFLSANSDKKNLDAAKVTQPFGFLVKPFRERDVLVMLDVALYRCRELAARNSHLKKAAPTSLEGNPYEIVGKSDMVKELLHNLNIVASSDTSVLIAGESGTGKELIAQNLHQRSPRKNGPMVVVNCGALPPGLIESELFGHEKGSFTGAMDRRVGKFAQADGGTIFLDEIGELPLDLQVKFLRVLQEKEIEPIGGKKMKINVRVVAATNRDLEEEIAQGRFRLDLYYRLNVFPLFVPPLRERKEDIPLLAAHFVRTYAAKENKNITGIADAAIGDLVNYPWPGNIRELENIIARTVLVNSGDVISNIQLPKGKKVNTSTEGPVEAIKSIAEMDREYIISVLIKCGWKIHGQGGAAEVLQINGSTLRSRMKKLGIDRNVFMNHLRK